MRRALYLFAGWSALAIGAVGIFLPLLPTVPLWILAAYCFSRSSPRIEGWLLAHPVAGPHIAAWRRRGAISRKGKLAASLALTGSAVIGLLLLRPPLSLLPAAAALLTATWIWTRPH